MSLRSCALFCRRAAPGAVALTMLAASLGTLADAAVAAPAGSQVSGAQVQRVSSDSLPQNKLNGSSFQLGTEDETDTFSWGSTVVSSFQVGRNTNGYGAQAIGWATSTDGGSSWTHGVLPGLSASSPVHPDATYPTVVNQSVAYSASQGEWIIPSVGYVANGTGKFHEKALLINRSTDGTTWSDATTAVATNVDKAWGVCDNNSRNSGDANAGTCYVAYSQIDSGDALAVVSSTDGGATWSAPVSVPSATPGTPAVGYNTNPIVQPDGTVVLVTTDLKNGSTGSALLSSVSSDGGQSWTVPTTLATIKYHTPPGGVRAKDKPTVDVDSAGTVYAAWSDCRFHAKCAADDIVYATSTDGVHWSAPIRVATDPVTTATDKFIPGFGVEPGTSGSTAHLSAVYYTYQAGSCSSTCLLQAEYTTSLDGGATWSSPYVLSPSGFPVAWLAKSPSGRMVGDYLSVSFVAGTAVSVVSLAGGAPTGTGTNTVYDEGEYALTVPAAAAPGASALTHGGSKVVTSGRSTTLSSTLTSAHHALAGQTVRLQRRAPGTRSFTTVAKATTSGRGVASVKLKIRSSYGYRWIWSGSRSYTGSTSGVQAVHARATVSVARTAARVRKGATVRLYGGSFPTVSGDRVALQRRVGHQWKRVGKRMTLHRRTLPDGTRRVGYVFTWSAHSAGRYVFRVVRLASRATAPGVSRALTITVR